MTYYFPTRLDFGPLRAALRDTAEIGDELEKVAEPLVSEEIEVERRALSNRAGGVHSEGRSVEDVAEVTGSAHADDGVGHTSDVARGVAVEAAPRAFLMRGK